MSHMGHSTGSKASPNVRYAFNGDRILCVATNQRDVPGTDIGRGLVKDLIRAHEQRL